MRISSIILFCFLLFSSMKLSATHILSANMTYECISAENYIITLIIYRDCDNGSAFLDEEIPISVFQGTDFLFMQPEVISSREQVVYEPYADCDPNAEIVCIEKGIYSFELNLPKIDEDYHIVYQRCCWAADIVNLVDPLETGITVESVITPIGQEICNSQSPIEFPMAITSCPNVPFSFSLPNINSEGNELEYELCTPLRGGGAGGMEGFPGISTSCDGIIPTPACPPPYETVVYSPGFTEENPFPTVDGFNFNTENNTLEFTPSVIGRYVFGICTKEYQDGDLVSYHSSIGSLANVVMPITSSFEPQQIEEWNVNYTNGFIHINKLQRLEKTKVQVFSPSGQLIHTREIESSNKIEIPATNYASGIYYVRILENKLSSIKKVRVL